MVARAFGTASISFGLVSIPVKVYTTSKSSSQVSFNMLHDACGTRLKQQYICPEHDEVVSRDSTVKGYEYAKGKYVVLSADEIKRLEAVSDNAISLSEFVPTSAVDPLYYEKAYYLGPDKGGERSYQLLGHAMRETGLVGIGRYASRGKQYVVLLKPYGEVGITMHQLRYQDELRGFDEVPLGEVPPVTESELALAVQIIEQRAGTEFLPDNYQDDVKERVLALIEKKLEGEEIAAPPTPQRGEIIDLMEALKASLGASDVNASPSQPDAAATGDASAGPASTPAKASAATAKETPARRRAKS